MAACRGGVLAGAAVAELSAAATSMPRAVIAGRWATVLGIACMPGAAKDLVAGSTSGMRARQELLASGHSWEAGSLPRAMKSPIGTCR